MMYVEFMKNFLLADSREMMAVRLILASWAQKRLIPTFYTSCTSSSWKIFFSADSSELMAVRLILASWAKNKWFLLEFIVDRLILMYMMYVELMKNFLPADSTIGC